MTSDSSKNKHDETVKYSGYQKEPTGILERKTTTSNKGSFEGRKVVFMGRQRLHGAAVARFGCWAGALWTYSGEGPSRLGSTQLGAVELVIEMQIVAAWFDSSGKAP